MTLQRDQSHMLRALSEAEAAAARGEVPIGAVIAGPDGALLAAAGNRTRELNDPTAHAELLVIRAACARLGAERLTGCDLYVTLEPCPMCAAAISFARIRRLYYGARRPQGRRRRARRPHLQPADLPPRAGDLSRHRRGARRRAAAHLLPREALGLARPG